MLNSVMVHVIDPELFCLKMAVSGQEISLRMDMAYGVVFADDGTYLLNEQGVGSGKPIEEFTEYIPVCDSGKVFLFGSPIGLRVSKNDKLPIKNSMPLNQFIKGSSKGSTERLVANYKEWLAFFSKRIAKQVKIFEEGSDEWMGIVVDLLSEVTPEMQMCSHCKLPVLTTPKSCRNCGHTTFIEVDIWDYMSDYLC